MDVEAIAYLVYGLFLVVALVAVVVFYYSKKRHKKIESAKHRMLEDED